MKPLETLTRRQLEKVVRLIQHTLYLDHINNIREPLCISSTARFWWHPDKEWNPDTLDDIADILRAHDLVPDEIAPHEGPGGSRA